MRVVRMIALVATLLAAPLGSSDGVAEELWDQGWGGPAGSVDVEAVGSSAQVSASSVTGSGGTGVALNQDYVAFDEVPASNEPVVATQVCRLVNAGEIDPLRSGAYSRVCVTPSEPEAVEEDPSGTDVDPEVVAATAVASMVVPAPEVVFDPDPGDNQWGSWVIGLPLWVDVQGVGSQSAGVSHQGVEVELRAERGEMLIDWGDGESSVCTRWGGWNSGLDIRTATPLCGHTYQQPGKYTVSATAAWTVRWSALGQSGTLPLTSTGHRQVSVIELQAVVTG